MLLRRFAPVLFIVGTVTALSAAPDTTDPAPNAAPAQTYTLSRDEMRARQKTMNTKATDDYTHVSSLRDRAKKKQDVVKLNCVNDKLVQVKAQMNIAQSSSEHLTASLEMASDTERNSAFDQLSEATTAVQKLREEAGTCMGEDEMYKQEAGVDVDAPEVIDDPTTIDPYDPGVVSIDPPGYASPYE